MSVRAVVLTSTFLRHHFVVNRLAASLDVVGVWQENKSFVPERYAHDEQEQRIIAEHFAQRDASEQRYFGDHHALTVAGALRRVGGSGIINDAGEIDAMKALRPDVVLVFGTGLLGRGVIEAFRGNIINLHLGLSPYYRGAGTNFWPLVNREPEYVGATIHYLDAGIDTGPMIAHARPPMAVADGPHDVGNKTIAAAVEVLAQCACAHVAGAVEPVPQRDKGRLYQRKDFSAGAVLTLRRNFETGMIAEYLSDKSRRDEPLHLLGVPSVA